MAVSLSLWVGSGWPAAAGPPEPEADWVPQPDAAPAWRVVERGVHAQVWEAQTVWVNRANGRQRVRSRRFVELAPGLNYQDEQGRWQPGREQFAPAADGSFVARQGPHQVVVGPNVNGWAVQFQTPEGLRVRAGPVAVGYFDAVRGRNFILATIRDAAGQLTGPNEVTLADCFEGLKASGAFTITNATTSATSNITLGGVAPVQICFIRFAGRATNEPVTWPSVTNWAFGFTLTHGANPISLQGYDRFTNGLAGASASITVTREP